MAMAAGWATAEEAAAYIGYKPQTLANWRNLRKGPLFSKVNGWQVRYRYSDLDAWMRDQARAPAAS